MRTTIISQGKALFVICTASACWAFSFGLSGPLASLWLQKAGCSDTIIGLNTAIYYAGLALAALAVPILMRRWGAACTTVGMAVAGLSAAIFPLGDTLAWWFALRLINGMAGALSLIPMETFVNRDLAPEHRGRNFGLYAVALTLGWALGNWVGLNMVHEWPCLAFIVGGAAAMLGAYLVHAELPALRMGQSKAEETVAFDLRDNLLSFGSAWSQGFLEGGMVAFMSLYLIALGLSEQHAGWLTSLTMIGVIVVQVPVAWLADCFGRQLVLLACYGMVVVGLIGLPLGGASALLPMWLFVVGASSGAFYPLGLALLGENLPPGQLDRANAWYLSIECVGSLMGPAAMGVARDWAGEAAMFAVGEAAVLLVLAIWLAGRRKAAPAAVEMASLRERKRAA
jgi:MFS family permease